MTMTQMNWALRNISEERNELFEMIGNIVDGLKQFINYDLYKQLEKQRAKAQEESTKKNVDLFTEKLREHSGKVSDDELDFIKDRYKK